MLLVVNYRKWSKDIEELQTVVVRAPIVSDPDYYILQKVFL